MKTTIAILLAAVFTLCMYCALTVPQNLRRDSERRSVSAALSTLPPSSLVEAAHAFAHNRGTNSSTVPLRDLITGGYLRIPHPAVLEDRAAVVVMDADESTPSAVLVRVRLLTGRNDLALFCDGSIAGLPIAKQTGR